MPANYMQYLEDVPFNFIITKYSPTMKEQDLIHLFVDRSSDLEVILHQSKYQIKPTGMIWISWPKKSSKCETDLSSNLVRTIGLESGLVDIKVAAIDEVWSGLKFVIRKKDR